MKTFGTLFSGGGLADIGYKAAGLTPVCAVEIEPALAELYRANHGDHITVADVCDVNFMRLERPDLLHASPVCKEFSVAKSGGKESALDLATAEATARAIEVWLPEVVFIENVWLYRHSKSFDLLCAALTKHGYWFDVNHLNAADAGVPQTRKRLILRASRDGWLPPLPPKTPWRGWYQAIEDLIPTLPESKFADWQLARLPAAMSDFLLMTGNSNFTDAEAGRGCKLPQVGAATCTAGMTGGMPKAFLVDDQLSHGGTQAMVRDAEEPAFTAMTRQGAAALPRAFIVDGKPANYAGDLQVIGGNCPVVTITASQPSHPFRAWLEQGRVVSMTCRALGRFQGVPDSYTLSGNTKLDCTAIGNGVCPPLAQALAAPFVAI